MLKVKYPNQWFIEACVKSFKFSLLKVLYVELNNCINKEGVLFDYRTKEPLSNQTLNEDLKKDMVNGLKRGLNKSTQGG